MAEPIKVSVCIPVYKVEKCIERCARSLFEQTLTEGIEFIFVDDCSPDGSVDVLRRVLRDYPARGAQTRVIGLAANAGVANARNVALDAAIGEYVIHCDSDDWVERDAYERLYRIAREHDADVVCCKGDKELETHDVLGMIQEGECTGDEMIIRHMPSDVFNPPWNKLYRRSTLLAGGVRYSVDCFAGEDMLFNVQAMRLCQRVVCVSDTLYHYCDNPGSLSYLRGAENARGIVRRAKFIGQFLAESKFAEARDRIYRNALLAAIKFGVLDSVGYRELRRELSTSLCDDPRLGIVKRMLLRLSVLSYPLAHGLTRLLMGRLNK